MARIGLSSVLISMQALPELPTTNVGPPEHPVLIGQPNPVCRVSDMPLFATAMKPLFPLLNATLKFCAKLSQEVQNNKFKYIQTNEHKITSR